MANSNNDYNRRGGYNVGEKYATKMNSENDQYSMNYFMSGTEAPSIMTIEWTQLLGCGVDEDGDKIHDCEIVIQSMCQDDTESTINDPADIEDVYTIKNGFTSGTINYIKDSKDLDDPQGKCFIDQRNRDVEGKHLTMPNDGSLDNMIDYCKNFCKKHNFIYAGVQDKDECFCGNTFGRYGLAVNQDDCSSKCRDKDEKTICGGRWRNNVYLSGKVDPSEMEAESKEAKIERKLASNGKNKGLHESWESYERCPSYYEAYRRNPAHRSGFECLHERQNYPVDYATQWTDIAYFTDDRVKCMKARKAAKAPIFECVEFYRDEDNKKNGRKHKSNFDNQQSCQQNGGDWLAFYKYKQILNLGQSECSGDDKIWGRPMNWKSLSDDLLTRERCLVIPDEVDCQELPNTRQNYLGMADGTNEAPRYKWKLPIYPKDQRCVLRIRQFISNIDEPEINYSNLDIHDAVGQSLYLGRKQKHSDSNKIVYEDRSHIFKLSRRPNSIPQDKRVHNIGVRGKRGNIVQTFPAVEYDFIPNKLSIPNGDAVHFQWTGSNTHDNDGNSDGQAGDDGEGQGGTDRNNMIQLYYNKVNFPLPQDQGRHTLFERSEILWHSHPDSSATNNKAITPLEASLAHATSGYHWSVKDVESKPELNGRLNNASPSFRGMVFIPGRNEKYYYVGMRNNNFSNRSQKGQLIVGRPDPNRDAELRKSLKRERPVDECAKYDEL